MRLTPHGERAGWVEPTGRANARGDVVNVFDVIARPLHVMACLLHVIASLLHVIASGAKQSILSSCGKMDCFAPLAMTAGAMDCFASLAMTAGAMDCFAAPVIGHAFARPVGGR